MVRGAGMALAVVLLSSSGAKILAPVSQGLVPAEISNVAAVLEALCGMALVFERTRRSAAWAAVILATGFSWAIAYYAAIGADVTRCGCLGSLEMSLGEHIGAIGGVLLLAGVATRDVRRSCRCCG